MNSSGSSAPDVIFTRIYHATEEEFGDLSQVSYIEIANGLCWLAAVARREGYAVEIVDTYPDRIDNRRLAEIILEKNPRVVGISACTMDIYGAADLADRLKREKPEMQVVVGGSHVTALPEETMKCFPSIDIVVVGEGEETIVHLLRALESGRRENLAGVDGIVYREGGELRRTPPRALIRDLDTLPLPAWDLLPDLRAGYRAPAWTQHAGRTVTIITSRGCPHQCIFCDRTVFGNRVRQHGAEYVLAMIRTLYHDYGMRHFRISDDHFTLGRERLFRICDAIIADKLEVTWSCLARIDSINPESLAKMKSAGCWSIAFGIESGSQKILDFEKKKVTLEQIARSVAMTRAAGIKVISLNMIGHPLETIDTIKETIRFNKRIKVDDFKTQFMMPFPGTELYSMAHLYGQFDPDWRKMSVFREPVFIPNGLTREDLIRWNKKGFISFYTQPRVILAYLRELRNWAALKTMIQGGWLLMCWQIRMLFGRERRHA